MMMGVSMTISMESLSGARKGLRRVGMFVALTIAFQASAAPAANDTAREAGVGVGSAFASLLYAPTKLVYATLGLVFGGLAWGLSGGDADVKNAVILPAVRGDYVVTPAVIRGEEKLEFVGRRPGYGRGDQIVAEEIEEGF